MVEVTGTLRDLPRAGNPGQFEFGEHLADRGIMKLMTASSGNCVKLLEKGSYGPARILWTIRARSSMAIQRALPGEDGGLLAALLLGDRSGLDPASRQAFTYSGTVHLLAVSGLHLMLVATGIFLLIRLMGIRGKFAASLLIVFVWLFAGLTGGRTPVVRAAVMSTVYFAAELFGRERSGFDATLLSAGILLFSRPSDLFSPGFQLSFSAVLGILAFARPLGQWITREQALVIRLSKMGSDRTRARIAHWIGMSLSVSAAAWIATAPLVLYHFNILTPVTPLANLPAAPLTAALLAVGFFTLPIVSFGPALAPAALPAGALARLLGDTARFFADLPLSHIHLPAPSLWRLIAGYALLAALALGPWRLGRRKRFPAYIFILTACLLFFLPQAEKTVHGLEMTTLDVGQGSCTVIRIPDGRTLLYDAGARGSYDVGEGIIAPFLWSKGVRAIDLMVLSHSDVDHVSAVESLSDRFEIVRVLVPTDFGRSPHGMKVLACLAARGVAIQFANRTSLPPPSWRDVLQILHPPQAPGPATRHSTNDSSLVLAVEFAGRTILLPGDLEVTGLGVLWANSKGIDFDVILAPHHGSNEVSGNANFARTGPSIVLMSCGWGFGVDATSRLYHEHGARVFETRRAGAVTVRISRGGAVSASGFRSCGGGADPAGLE
jgi:competence protein ComEC